MVLLKQGCEEVCLSCSEVHSWEFSGWKLCPEQVCILPEPRINTRQTESVDMNPGYPGKSEFQLARRDFQSKCDSGFPQAQFKFNQALPTDFTSSSGRGLCRFQPLILPRGQMQTPKFRGREAGREVRLGMESDESGCGSGTRDGTRTSCLEQQGLSQPRGLQSQASRSDLMCPDEYGQKCNSWGHCGDKDTGWRREMQKLGSPSSRV